ncbi:MULTISPECIES: dicarboxylate/amino acid:cation symporter [unclassified Fusibacter]|uniref:dicarboxylate/amino acid:cation symporter n=1 Tax=unclassified Fusibacter TaxID=2624464 RepID=UPI0010135603|nr:MULTISPECIES: dicarboxylate/amino acid:cation symporter [unclassified Fusibacter]MCK8060443.1 dicarboxylate/amino acid:cation symporter [Fusibacter sp. A2]NPE20268.1 dicarboxylate/amino acid:cation symporter [Fusibacter sp. A1]RXV63475.1 dicarboxylate/amino acid:cation symporter [Fusibacter sp. A1]
MKNNLLVKLVIGILAGIAIGLVSAAVDMLLLVRLMSTFSSIFGNFLKFIIPCIIIGFVAPGIAELGKDAGKMLGLTAVIAYSSAVGAGIMAFLIGKLILPIVIKSGAIEAGNSLNVSPFFSIEMGTIMGVMTALVLAFVLGIGMSHLNNNKLYQVMKDFQHIIEGVVKKVLIPFIPLHIAGIFAKIAATGEIFSTIAAFSSVFVLILILQLSYILVQYAIAWMVSGKHPLKAIRNMLPAYVTALGTQSSAATIAVTLTSARKNDISEDVVDFVIPLGATIHLAGDTITLVLASMAVMLLSGVTPTFALMLPFIFMLGITMVAAPGIPGGGVMAALGLLENMLGFTAAQQGLMIALHFAQDSFGTATNVTGDGAIAIIIDTIHKKDLMQSDKAS